MEPTVHIEKVDLDRVFNRAVKQISDPKKLTRFHRDIIRFVLALNRKRVRAQKNLDGSSYQTRKKAEPGYKQKRGKLLKKVLRPNQITVVATALGASITANNPVARKHHYGIDEDLKPMTPSQIKKETGLSLKDPCSKPQALRLQGIFQKRMTLKSIIEKYSIGRASAIILRYEPRKKQATKIATEAREILGFATGDDRLIVARLSTLIERYRS